MKGQHLRAFLWLRWRLFANQVTRGGTLNKVILIVLASGTVPLVLFLFVVFFLLGLFALGEAEPAVLMLVWDALVVGFLILWCVSVLADLQRTDALSLEKFLHLPVSLSGVFVLNYLSSLFSLNLLIFVPMMVGFSLGLVMARGPAMLILLPLTAAFLLMVTALTYQFQGWLAALMVNKRRRRTVIVVMTMAFILLFQLPNLLNWLQPWHDEHHWTPQEKRVAWEQVQQGAWLVNLVLPPGWLPFGAMSAAVGNVPAALGCTLGLTLIGAASLWRAYGTTLRLYTGQFTSGTRQPSGRTAHPLSPPGPTGNLLEKHIPFLSEPASVIALGGFCSLTRTPEAKMLLLTPVLLVMIFGGLFWQNAVDVPAEARPMMAYGAMAMILFTLVQFAGNQFGFDRAGFRVFVLSPAPRRDILLGKNLAVAPLALVLCLATVGLVQGMYPMRLTHLFAVPPQFVSMYLLLCLLGNGLSILTPMPVASGSLKPANPQLLHIVVQMMVVFLLPLALAPTLLPLGIELFLETLAWTESVPVCLVLTLIECTAIVALYRLVLTWQGNLLLAREKRILESVTTKAE